MRLTGAALLTAAGLLSGLLAARALRARALRRGELCRMLELMAFQLGRFHTPMPALFDTLAFQTEGAGACLCRRMTEGMTCLGERDFAGIWADALAFLPARERDILRPLGPVLGRYGTQEQLRAVETCRQDMEEARREAATAAREKGRMYVGLSAAGGAALSVLLL